MQSLREVWNESLSIQQEKVGKLVQESTAWRESRSSGESQGLDFEELNIHSKNTRKQYGYDVDCRVGLRSIMPVCSEVLASD